MNGEVCCILAVCCPPQSAQQIAALAKELVKDNMVEEANAHKVATWIVQHFDLAPEGSLVDFKAAIAKHAKSER